MMRQVYLALIMSLAFTHLTGCKELTAYINDVISTEPLSTEEIFRQKLKEDLQGFNRISRFGSQSFLDLEAPLRKASDKQQSTEQLRSELLDFSDELQAQNELFKTYHFRTNEGAKLRNKAMQLNYATIQIIQVLDNPMVVERRLHSYLKRQRTLIDEYEDIKADITSKI